MKDIINTVWNASASAVLSTVNKAILFYAFSSLISLILILILTRIITYFFNKWNDSIFKF